MHSYRILGFVEIDRVSQKRRFFRASRNHHLSYDVPCPFIGHIFGNVRNVGQVLWHFNVRQNGFPTILCFNPLDGAYSMKCVVYGSKGRVGSAICKRLIRDGYDVMEVDVDTEEEVQIPLRETGEKVIIFHCAWVPGEEKEHVAMTTELLYNWYDQVEAIFVPSSWHIGTDTDYARAKMVVENLLRFFAQLPNAARIITDRIGYFPGDDAELDTGDPFIDKFVGGEDLYQRIMRPMLGLPSHE